MVATWNLSTSGTTPGVSRMTAGQKILKTIKDPDNDLDVIVIKNVPARCMDPEIPAACAAEAAKHKWSMQIAHVLAPQHGTPQARKRTLIFLEDRRRAQDLGPTKDPSPCMTLS